MEKIYHILCASCGMPFESPTPAKKYCSDRCKQIASDARAVRQTVRKLDGKKRPTLNEDIRAASASGMSYGYWMALGKGRKSNE